MHLLTSRRCRARQYRCRGSPVSSRQIEYYAISKEAAIRWVRHSNWDSIRLATLCRKRWRARRSVAKQRLTEILAAAKLADASGLDVFAVGEHHRLDMVVSAAPVVLAAIAAVTERIRLASAVTILSTADPVMVFEDFATIDLISGGRAEIIAGRGIFTESFPLFGYDLADYDDLFAEKIELLMQLNAAERVTWQGRFRAPLKDAPIAPRPAQSRLPIWVGTGGTQSSVARAGALGLPLALVNISIPPAKLAPLPISTGAPDCRPGTCREHTQGQHRHPHAHQGKLARCPERVLSVLCWLFSHPHTFAIASARDQTSRL